METTRHNKIVRPQTTAQMTRSPDPDTAPLTPGAETVTSIETGQQLAQANQRGHRLGQFPVIDTAGLVVQAKLTVGAANDTYEQEADRVADHVLRMAEPEDGEKVQRKTGPEDEEMLLRQTEPGEEENLLQRAGGAASFAAGSEVEQHVRESRGHGNALPAGTRAFMEPRFGADFSQVSVHSDAQADQLNRQLSARAFTTGRDIYFRQGAYAPHSESGRQLLAHELAHVVQQGSAEPRIQRENGDGDTASTSTSPVDPVAGLKTQISEQRAEIYAILRENPQMLRSDSDNLEIVLRQLNTLAAQLAAEPDKVKDLMKTFKAWREGDGYAAWDTFVTHRTARAAARKAREDREAAEAAAAAARRAAAVPTWSAECDAVFADMNNQFGRWDGTKTHRGAWWGSAQPGSKAGAKRVPEGVVIELQRRIHGTTWRFSDSFSGGISFHRTRGSVDFIYHMLPP